MKTNEVLGLKTFKARVKLPNKHYTTVIDTMVVARNYELAKRLLQAQYGADSVIGNVQEVK